MQLHSFRFVTLELNTEDSDQMKLLNFSHSISNFFETEKCPLVVNSSAW